MTTRAALADDSPRPDSLYREAWLRLSDRVRELLDGCGNLALTAPNWETVLRTRGSRDAYDTVLAAFNDVEAELGVNPRG